MEKFWPTCLRRFEQELSAQQFNTWIKPLTTEVVGNNILVVAPNKFVQKWVKDRFLKKLETIAEELFSTNVLIEITTSKKSNTPDNGKNLIRKASTESKLTKTNN
ncbi:MAG: chromosomal replication initiator protein, partial [Methylophilaceae bacterium]